MHLPIPSYWRVMASKMISIAFPLTSFIGELFASFTKELSPRPPIPIGLLRSGRGSIRLSNPFVAHCTDPKELSPFSEWTDYFGDPLTIRREWSEVCFLPINRGPYLSKPTPPPQLCWLLTPDFFYFLFSTWNALAFRFFLPIPCPINPPFASLHIWSLMLTESPVNLVNWNI